MNLLEEQQRVKADTLTADYLHFGVSHGAWRKNISKSQSAILACFENLIFKAGKMVFHGAKAQKSPMFFGKKRRLLFKNQPYFR